VATRLADAGYAVMATDIPSERDALALVASGIRSAHGEISVATADVRDQSNLDEAFQSAVSAYGPVTTVVANAGYGLTRSFWELDEDEWADSLDVTLSGAWRTAKAASRHLADGEGVDASIVFVGSTAGERASRGFASYVAAKHGLVGLMRSVALELAPRRIRANAVLLGTVDTPGTRTPQQRQRVTGSADATPAEYQRAIDRMHALPFGAPMDPLVVADVMVWLASPAARYITGSTIPVDAGRLLLPGLQD
jgi:NAD(P)-dependent dehydrogenase (short-subunit alcohol dehydrogenase family)